MHKFRERDQTLVKKAKGRFINKNSKLFCEACNFSFEEKYGVVGKEYIEAHHKKPLSQIQAGEKTKESDLVMLCANCHRIVHKLKSPDPWSKLLRLLGK